MSDFSVGSYTNSLYDIYNDAETSKASALENKLNNKLGKDKISEAEDSELMDACKEFEAYFTEQVFKAMEKTVTAWQDDEDEDSSSKYKEYAQDNLLQQFATSSSNQGEGLGIAKMLYEQMKRNYT